MPKPARIPPNWLTLAADIVAVLTIVLLALAWYTATNDADRWSQRVYRVCEHYAGLDLAELAPLCADAGYQQVVTVSVVIT